MHRLIRAFDDQLYISNIYNYYYRESCCEIAHMHWLILTFNVHLYPIIFADEQRKLWWDCTYAPTYLNPRQSPNHNIICRWAEKALVKLSICTDSSEPSIFTLPHTVSRLAEKTLVKLNICIDSSDPSSVTYTAYCYVISRKSSGDTAYTHRLIWINSDTDSRWAEMAWIRLHICKTHLSLLRSAIPHTDNCWAEMAQVRLHKCDFSEPSLVNCTTYRL